MVVLWKTRSGLLVLQNKCSAWMYRGIALWIEIEDLDNDEHEESGSGQMG